MDNYQFYFNKLFTSKDIKIQIDVLTKEMVTTSWTKWVTYIISSLGTGSVIYNYTCPDTAVKTALVAGGARKMLDRKNTLFSHGYGYGEASVEGALPLVLQTLHGWSKPGRTV